MKLQDHTSVRGLAVAATLAFAMACGGSSGGPDGAPMPNPNPSPSPGMAQISVSPQSGTTATDVRVTGSGFAPNSTVRIGFGPPESEYEVIGRTSADASGRIGTTVSVPNWADAGRDYLFVGVPPSGDEALSSRFAVRASMQGTTLQVHDISDT